MEVLISPIPAVLVANGYEDVRQAAIAGPMKAGNCGKLYCARGDLDGMSGNYAAGILEGIAHSHPGSTVQEAAGEGIVSASTTARLAAFAPL